MLTLVSEQDYTLVTVSGELRASEIVDAFRRFVDGPWSDALWDVSGANVAKIFTREILDAVHALRKIARGHRRPGRAAVVCPEDVGYGVAREFAAMLGGGEYPAEVRVFRHLDEAKTWLAQGRFQGDHSVE